MKRSKELNPTKKIELNSLSVLYILKISVQILYFIFSKYLKSTTLTGNTTDVLSFYHGLAIKLQYQTLRVCVKVSNNSKV